MAKAKTILVTGANGFVGSRLSAELAQRGKFVSRLVRPNSLMSDSSSTMIVKELTVDSDCSAMLNDIEIIIHLAARVHVMQDTSQNPLAEFLVVNFHTTVNLAQQAAVAGVKRFVYVSSAKVNGEHTEQGQRFSENDIPNPQDPYAISKWQAELALHEIGKKTGMQIVIVRPPLVYGGRVKANFLKLMWLVDKPLPLPLGNINNSRSMIYVDNLVDALIACATHPNASGQTYLVSDDEHLSTQALVRSLSTVLSKPDRVFPFPVWMLGFLARLVGKSDAVNRLTQSLVIDNSKIKSQLGWHPPFTLEQGLTETAKWFKATKQ